MENTLPDVGTTSQFGSTVSVVAVAVRMNRDCPAPVPLVIQTIRPAQVVENPVPVSVFAEPPVAVPEATPLSIVMVEPTSVIAIC
jgi:hypothetical protein